MQDNNYRNANDISFPSKIKTTVCIIGAGAAGITLARNLKNVDDVLLIESGDFNIDGNTQALYKGKNTGLPYFDLLSCRLRYFGGTTNHWGGYCRANDPIDYEGRDSIGLPKWPVNERTLAPYINVAAKELGLNYDSFDTKTMFDDKNISQSQLIENSTDDLYTKTFQLSNKLRFSEIYRDELGAQKNLKVCLNLNVVHIQLSAKDGVKKVNSILCKTLSGKLITIEAKEYILATHAIENAKILLNSNDIEKEGIGNKYDHVGRYFMDHIKIEASKLIPSKNFPNIYDRNVLKDLNLNANISFTDDYLRKNNLLQYYCRFMPVYTEDDVVESLKGLESRLGEPFSNELFEDIQKVVNDFSGAGIHLLSHFGVASPTPRYFHLDHRIEQAPNPNSRVVIANEKDALGVPRANLQWELNEHDYRTFEVGQSKIVSELSAFGAGRFVVEEITPKLVDERVAGHYHHIGTTRMSESPSDGVVDANGKVHSVTNLYVAGSSVFPTAGYSGPTMMIVALSLRLAEHITKKIGA
jgi:choline dehydrogenase-like flavoprotein